MPVEGKENITDGLEALTSAGTAAIKSAFSKKSRSLSMGPGALSVPLKEAAGNRRKSAIADVPAVRSILSGKEDEAKLRREARRKSLANRRVSFAPEATLHTWDVVECMRDATSSSASSDATRRSDPAPARDDASEEDGSSDNAEELEEDSPAPRKKARRSSGIPPLNFNNPEDVFSSSTSSSPMQGAFPQEENTAMSLPQDSPSTSSSEVQLDAALRLAAAQAGTQDHDLDADLSMEMVTQDVTAAFRPWLGKPNATTAGGAMTDPFKAPTSDEDDLDEDDDGSQDMSMDMTSALGGIISFQGQEQTGSEESTQTVEKTQAMDVTMDFTQAFGAIQPSAADTGADNRGTKRRRSGASVSLGVGATSEGSPAIRQFPRRYSTRRHSVAESVGEVSMDLTKAIGGILSSADPTSRHESTETDLLDEAMDFTMAIGGIKSVSESHVDEGDESDASMSMDLTSTLEAPKPSGDIPRITPSPAKTPKSPLKTRTPSPAKSPAKELPKPRTPQKSPRRSQRKSLVPPTNNDVQTSNSPGAVIQALRLPKTQDGPLRQDSPPNPVAYPTLPAVTEPTTPPKPEVVSTSVSPDKLKTTALADSFKLLSTPRKQILPSPVKRAASTPKVQATPKKAMTPKKAATPRKSPTPRKRVRLEVAEPIEEEAPAEDVEEAEEDEEDVERIHLQDFLDMTGIRFMDLTTTKRRHTGHPGADRKLADADEEDEVEPTLENTVAAAISTVPMLTMYQHSCHEMKNYISGGRDEFRVLEAEVYESQPPLFCEYLLAPPQERAIMDNQFKNMKTNARLQSKAGWHAWRSQLLTDLMKGLQQSAADLDRDDTLLTKQEQLLDSNLPPLLERYEKLDAERQQLEERAAGMSSSDREELVATREQLLSVEAGVEEQKRLVAELQKKLEEQEVRIETAKKQKAKHLEDITEAERVLEECRGWSESEIAAEKAKLDAIEQRTGWSVVAVTASPKTLTLKYRSDLELFLNPDAFITKKASPASGPNSPISLTYVGDVSQPSSRARPLTTTKRFFLQLLRAHVHALPQCETRVQTLTGTISAVWDAALRIAEGVRKLDLVFMTKEVILGDETMAVDTVLLLTKLKTKVQIRFEVVARLGEGTVSVEVGVKAKVAYGERYDEAKMSEFLKQFVNGGDDDAIRWVTGMEDLQARLIKRGKKV
ncbi:Spc7-domain-containing protein [Trichodelitschia bisporula]|uniref:Spc7-domain-containing protein n=1 Tax=Trichodelitschia bisporula TaxID=703511 RepID=A0A6G1I3Z4_9PEZI|nr:Spc7-domain-containing protein [Trichodelitschia bisporula]